MVDKKLKSNKSLQNKNVAKTIVDEKKPIEKVNDQVISNDNNENIQPLHEQSGTIRIILLTGLIIGLIILLIGLFLLFLKVGNWVYQNVPGDAQNLNPEILTLPTLNYSFSNIRQFYPNIKFNHNTITYQIDSACDSAKKNRMTRAFDMLSATIGKISFQYTSDDNPDISVICDSQKEYIPDQSDFFIAGEGGAKELVQTGRYNVITNGTIFLYGNPTNAVECSWPNIELHELIHVFGFNHSINKNSLMYPYLLSCNQKLDDSIVYELKRLYSEPNLPDLYFDNLSAVKKGRYLDFNVTVRNSGDVDALNATFSVIDDGKLVDTKEMKDIKYGAGIEMEIKNFKLFTRESKEIDIIIDYFNNTQELDKNNNIARIKF